MADSKRQSVAGKVATPKVGPSKDVNDDSVLYKAVGARIKIVCAPHNKVLEGTLFTTCNVTNAIAINTASSSSVNGDYHVIPFAHILSFEIVGSGERVPETAAGFDGALPSISRVDLEALKAREEQTIREMKKKDAQKGKGVTREAQELFDFIARTLPARWADTSIVVNDNVMINAPYSLNDIKTAAGSAQSKAHVQKVVDSFYQRKKASLGTNRPPAATPIAPRKGG